MESRLRLADWHFEFASAQRLEAVDSIQKPLQLLQLSHCAELLLPMHLKQLSFLPGFRRLLKCLVLLPRNKSVLFLSQGSSLLDLPNLSHLNCALDAYEC